MMDPAGVVTNITSTVSSSLTILKFISDLKNTPTDVKVCFDLTTRIDTDLQYLLTLRTQHLPYLLAEPLVLARADQIILFARDSILDVCRLLEGVRQNVYEGGKLPLRSKMRWVLSDSGAFTRRTGNLQQQHAAVNGEIAFLRQRDLLQPLQRIATTTFENVELLSMVRRKKSGSLLSMRSVSDFGKDTDRKGFKDIAPRLAPHAVTAPSSPAADGSFGLQEVQPLDLPERQYASDSPMRGLVSPVTSVPRLGSTTPVEPLTRIPGSVSAVSDLDFSTRHSSFRESTPLTPPVARQVGCFDTQVTNPYFDGLISVVSDDPQDEQPGMEVVESEEEDPEEAYYRDLRRQEEERLRRIESRRRPR